MKRILTIVLAAIILSSCGGTGGRDGELVGVPGRKKFYEPEPYQMVFVPQGSFTMGPSDEDVAWAMNTFARTVTVDAFWMDETEITNNKYRQFVYWVRDSIMRKKLGEEGIEGFLVDQDEDGNPIDPPRINWDTDIDMRDEEIRQSSALESMYYPEDDRLWGRKEFDTRKFIYSYFWIDMQQAAKHRYNYEKEMYEGEVYTLDGKREPIKGRSSFIMRDAVNVYPDTLVWIRDFSYSYNEPWAKLYFSHPSFDDYPVVGVSWEQASAFCIWRTNYLNTALAERGMPPVQDYRLPQEAEWEYAARGGLDHSMYPWGGVYTRNDQGCFLANFKPLRGNYIDDGAMTTAKVGTYSPNEYGLYDMAGNVAEWTITAYDESAYVFSHDMNPNYQYNALPSDPPALKRKVIRGGSWKDISYFLQTGTRAYEYQDSTKSYVGFRCVRSFMGTGAENFR